MKKLELTLLLAISPLVVFCQLISGIENADDSTAVKIYRVVDVEPVFSYQGMDLFQYFKYQSSVPISDSRESKDVVYFQVTIEESGEVSGFKILVGVSRELDEYTEELVMSMPKWNPGTIAGKPVKVVKNLSISYSKR
jgi:periplasmic protein TonB